MSRAQRLDRPGHNERFRLGAPAHDTSRELVVCIECHAQMQAVISKATGKPWERCFSCEERVNGPLAHRRRRR